MTQKLGKAKARAARAGETVMVKDSLLGMLPARRSGMTYTEARALAVANANKTVALSCDGCSACCYGKRIEVYTKNEPAERLAHMDLVDDEYGDKKMRRNEETGACVHLGPQGCTIYEHRPETCRTYDCRPGCLIGMRRAHDTPQGEVLEPFWLFDIQTKADSVEYGTVAAISTLIHQAEIPENPDHLIAYIRKLYDTFKPEVQKMIDGLSDAEWRRIEKKRAKNMLTEG